MGYLDSLNFMPSFDLEGAAFGGADYGEYPSFSFDVPQFEVAPYLADYESMADQVPGIAQMPQYFDTTTGQFVDQAGRPIDLGDTTLSLRGPLAQAGSERGAAPGSPEAGPGLFGKGGTLGAGGPVDQFMTGPAGRTLIPLVGGLASMGLGRAIAGAPPRLSLPPFTPSASTMAGENALVNAYSRGVGQTLPETLQLGVAGQRDIAQNLVRDIGAETPYADPVQQRLQQEILSVLSGSGVSPTTERRQQQERAALQNQLFRQLGPDYALTTAGQDAINKLAQRHNAEQFDERRATVSAYAPMEESRARFAYAAPTARTGQRQQILGSIAPTQPLLNAGGVDRANLYNTELQGRAATTQYGAETQNQRDLAAGIGQLGGRVAEAITRPPNPFDIYYRNLLSGAGGGGQIG